MHKPKQTTRNRNTPLAPAPRLLQRTAIHEAGHCVQHYLDRIPFDWVSIDPAKLSPGVGGNVYPYTGPLSWRLFGRNQTQEIRILVAGKAAEVFAFGKAPKCASESDEQLAFSNALDLLAPSRDVEGPVSGDLQTAIAAMLGTAYAAVSSTLTSPRYWPAVLALANAILERKTLTWRQASRVIRAALPNPYGADVLVCAARMQ